MGFLFGNHYKYSKYKVSHLEKAYDIAFDRAAAHLNKYNALKNQMNANYENMKRHYEENINQFKNEKNYPALSTASPENIVEAVNYPMTRVRGLQLKKFFAAYGWLTTVLIDCLSTKTGALKLAPQPFSCHFHCKL